MKNKRYYIAYGSNLSVEQMKRRCPDAKVIGKTIMHGWRLVFRIHATIEPDEGASVPIAIWEISERDEQNLDRYEGFPRYYIKKDVTMTISPKRGGIPRQITAMVYIMTKGRTITPPSKEYFDVIWSGYKHFKFDTTPLITALYDSLDAQVY